MKKDLGYSDKQKFNEYFESIRSIEVQMERLEEMKEQLSMAGLDEPADAHMPRGEYIRLMGDLMVTSLQVGLTNVATFMVGPERWDTPICMKVFSRNPKPSSDVSQSGKIHKRSVEG